MSTPFKFHKQPLSMAGYLFGLPRDKGLLVTMKNGESHYLESFDIAFDNDNGMGNILFGKLASGEELAITISHISTVVADCDLYVSEKPPAVFDPWQLKNQAVKEKPLRPFAFSR